MVCVESYYLRRIPTIFINHDVDKNYKSHFPPDANLMCIRSLVS